MPLPKKNINNPLRLFAVSRGFIIPTLAEYLGIAPSVARKVVRASPSSIGQVPFRTIARIEQIAGISFREYINTNDVRPWEFTPKSTQPG